MKKFKSLLLFVLAATLLLAAAACTMPVTPDPAVESVTIVGKPSGIQAFEAGKTYQLSALVDPDGTGAAVAWSSSDPAVATVSAGGLVTQVAAGMTRIAATAADKSDDFMLYLKGPLEKIELADRPSVGTEFYTGEKISLPYAVKPDLTDPYELTAATADPNVATVELNKAARTLTVIAGLVTGEAAVSLSIDGTEFFDGFTFKNAGEKPLKQDFDASNELTYTAQGGTASVVSANLPEGAESAKALTFASAGADFANPGVLFSFDRSKLAAGGLYRVSFKISITGAAEGAKIKTALTDSVNTPADPNRKYEFSAPQGDAATAYAAGVPFANRTYDRLLVALDGTGAIGFTVTDVKIARAPLTGITMTGKPAAALDLRLLKVGSAEPKYPKDPNDPNEAKLGVTGADGYAVVWSTSDAGAAAVNAATGTVTFKKDSGTVRITVAVQGTTLYDTADIAFTTSNPAVLIDDKQGMAGWRALGAEPVQLSGRVNAGTMIWGSGDGNVATVTQDGLLSFAGLGETTVTLSDGLGGEDSFKVGVYDAAETYIFDFDATPLYFGGYTGAFTTNKVTEGLPSGAVNPKGMNVNTTTQSTYPGCRFGVPMQVNAHYSISVKLNIISVEAASGYQLVIKDGKAAPNTIFQYTDWVTNTTGDYTISVSDYVYDGGRLNFDLPGLPSTHNQMWIYLRPGSGGTAALNFTVTDIVITKLP
ncbi:MAG: Ig-like domain-containing protein [Clostridiales bacterium]|jgi:hypothetical protein|nr:Ig-like domain-containing protein [Clostridiales bacterium]